MRKTERASSIMKGFKRPESFDKKSVRELKTDKCPACGKKLGSAELLKLKTLKRCKCSNCGKGIFAPMVYY